MTEDLSKNFISLRRALKVCSILLVGFAMLHTPTVVTSLGRSELLWYEMMGDKDGGWVFAVSRFLSNYFIFVALGLLMLFAGCIYFTKKSEGGRFLYLNVGIYLVLSVLNTFLLDAAQRMLQEPMRMISGQ